MLTALMLALVAQTPDADARIAVIPTQFDESTKGQVPDLFDDYLLSAVQNAGEFEVIGQDDIATLLGFEQQKDLLNCDDTSCMADIGGALGVDRIVSVKIARLQTDWVATAKLINIAETRVESRVNEIVSGDTKALLQAVPKLVRKLFADTEVGKAAGVSGAKPDTAEQVFRRDRRGDTRRDDDRRDRRDDTRRPPPPARAEPVRSEGPDWKVGRGARIGGTIMLALGAVVGIYGGIVASGSVDTTRGSFDEFGDFHNDTDEFGVFLGTVGIIAGMVLQGIGSRIRANGVARGETGMGGIKGSAGLNWLGWIMAGLTMAMPFFGILDIIDAEQAIQYGWVTGLTATGIFWIGGFLWNSPAGGFASLPVPTVQLARRPDGGYTPTAGVAFAF